MNNYSPMARRDLLRNTALGFGSLALSDMLTRESRGDDKLLNGLHFPMRAKRVIYLFMHGGPSHIDTFDYKPLLTKHNGEPLPFDKPRVQFAETGNLLKSPWEFRQYGQSGAWVSDLFPEVGKCVDDICFIKSMHGSNEAHGGALLKMHTGSDTFVRPSMGAWISYGLGSENENLPSFVTVHPTMGHGGVRNFGSAFLPAEHQATRIGTIHETHASIENLKNPQLDRTVLRRELDFAQQLNHRQLEHQGHDAMLEARIQSMELAFRMQSEAPEILDLSRETEATNRQYGLDQPQTAEFGRACLLSRRLSEAGVRFVQASHRYWDQHSELKEMHGQLAAEVDKPIAGLLQDLKARGLLDETLVIWGAEFGRTPTAQGNNGRDHNPHAFTYWMAGGGVKPGYSHGTSDDFGYYAAEDRVHVHDYHATLLYLLGIDHQRLTYRYGGRDFRLTDVAGRVVHEIIG